MEPTGILIVIAALAAAGYYFGRAVEAVLGDVRRYEVALISSVVAAAVLLWLVRLYRRRQARRGAGTV